MKRKTRKDELWAVWSGDDTKYFCYWSFAPSKKEAIERLALIWPNYPWEKARKHGCRCIKVSIKEITKK